MRLLQAMVFAIGLAGSASALGAAEIAIDDPRWLKLTDAQKVSLKKKLVDAKAIGADDTIVYKGGPDNTISEKNFNPGAAFTALGEAICKIKNLTTRSACAKIADAAERDKCNADEKARYDSSRSACKVTDN